MNKTLLDQLNQSQEQILRTTIDLVTEKELWKARAERLASKYQACLECGKKEEWQPEALRCLACYRKWKENPNA